MKIIEKKIKVSELVKNYNDDGEGGVFGYDNKLTIRPAYQREFVYEDKEKKAVIDTVRKGFPLNVMYWSKTGKDTYEVLDGQQRTISIAQYVDGGYSIMVNDVEKYYSNLTETEKKVIDNYELNVYICEGAEEEKLGWFKTINIAGKTLTNQELLNSTYTGAWLTDAKTHFSKINCVAAKKSDGYIKGNPIRQDLLEIALEWIANRDGLDSHQIYMAKHQNDEDADELWTYFQDVIDWAKKLFPNKRKLNVRKDWGLLYNKYKDKKYNTKTIETRFSELLKDKDVTNDKGIIPYILDGETKASERFLNLRAFDDSEKMEAYEKQKGVCPICGKKFNYEDMQGDHIVPWSKGGHTTPDNLQMLCRTCNATKSNK